MKYAILILAMMAGPVSAQEACGPREQVENYITIGRGEMMALATVTADGLIVETFVNPVTGSWTMTVRRPGGPTCLAATGEGFQIFALGEDT